LGIIYDIKSHQFKLALRIKEITMSTKSLVEHVLLPHCPLAQPAHVLHLLDVSPNFFGSKKISLVNMVSNLLRDIVPNL
jgi:hypothetical protein